MYSAALTCWIYFQTLILRRLVASQQPASLLSRTLRRLAYSLLFYRSLIEFIGGVGFIYILIAFLYPKGEIENFLSSFGIEAIGDSMKKLLALIMVVYTVIALVFTAIFYFSYSTNLILASSAAIDVLTGGYEPSIAAGIGFFQISVIVLMIIGGLNFKFHYNLFHLKLRELLTPEIKLYLLIIASSTVVISILAWVDPFVSLFHSASLCVFNRYCIIRFVYSIRSNKNLADNNNAHWRMRFQHGRRNKD